MQTSTNQPETESARLDAAMAKADDLLVSSLQKEERSRRRRRAVLIVLLAVMIAGAIFVFTIDASEQGRRAGGLAPGLAALAATELRGRRAEIRRRRPD
jgi:hypothetical protein